MITKERYAVGIDTGCNTGFSIWDRVEKKLLEVESTSIHKVILFIYGKSKSGNIKDFYFRVEDARLRKWIPKQANEKAERGRAQGAGSVKRDAKILDDLLKEVGANYEMVAPMNNRTKLDTASFKSFTKWEKKTNSHSRDAAMLVFGL